LYAEITTKLHLFHFNEWEKISQHPSVEPTAFRE